MGLPTAVYEYCPPGAPGAKGIRIECYADGGCGGLRYRIEMPRLDQDHAQSYHWMADSLGAVRFKLAFAFDDPELLVSASGLRRIWVDPVRHPPSDEPIRRPPMRGWGPRESR